MLYSTFYPCVASPSLKKPSFPAFSPFYNSTTIIFSKSWAPRRSKNPPRVSALHAYFPSKLGFQRRYPGFLVRASEDSHGNEAEAEMAFSFAGLWFSKRDLQIAAGAALVIVFSVANRVLYKMALVPMKEYPFFLALFNTFGYCLVYFSILFVRYRAHIVTDEMLKIPKYRFVAVGFLEALGVASGMAAAAVLPGASIPVLVQTFLIWQLIFSTIFLKKRYTFFQLLGCALVLGGVIIALISTTGGLAFSPDQAGLFWPFVMIFSASLQAGASIIKEFVFRDASKRLQGGSVDIFVVNSFGSGFQVYVHFIFCTSL